MVTRAGNIAIVVALVMACAGCYTGHFNYLENMHDRMGVFDCHVVSGYGSVENSGDSILIHRDGIVTLRKEFHTFTETELYLGVEEGESARIRFRTTDYGTSVAPGIDVTLGKTNSSVNIPGKTLHGISSRLTSEPVRVLCYDEGAQTTIVVGCDTVFCGKTAEPATDVIAVESVDHSTVVVRGLSSRNLRTHAEFRAQVKGEDEDVPVR